MTKTMTMRKKTWVTVDGKLEGKVSVPPSKSYTHRAVLMAALASGASNVNNPLISRDTKATIDACVAMGATIERRENGLRITGTEPKLPEDIVNVENSGTTLRFMTSAFALSPPGHAVLTGDASIRRRPMQPLLDTLGELGVQAWSSRANGCAPIIVKTGGIRGGDASIRGDVSSQFISSLLISTPLAERDTTIRVSEAVSRPYIDATLELGRRFGIKVGREDHKVFRAEARQSYRHSDFTVPADFSSASFITGAVALVGGTVKILNLDPSLPQGDSYMIEILREMGAKVGEERGALVVKSDGDKLKGGRFNLGDTPDLLPVVSALALNSSSPVEIVGTAHARFKETDRIAIVAKELSKLGVDVQERQDGLLISPPTKKLKLAVLDAHDDHRMFMAFSLASMVVPGGVPIVGAESLDVSYPTFLEDIKGLGAAVRSG